MKKEPFILRPSFEPDIEPGQIKEIMLTNKGKLKPNVSYTLMDYEGLALCKGTEKKILTMNPLQLAYMKNGFVYVYEYGKYYPWKIDCYGNIYQQAAYSFNKIQELQDRYKFGENSDLLAAKKRMEEHDIGIRLRRHVKTSANTTMSRLQK